MDRMLVTSVDAKKKKTVVVSDNRAGVVDDSFSSEQNNRFLFPGFADVHVHLREPGFSYKETIRTGTLAAARGGFTAVCAMPNLDPVPDTAAHLSMQTDIIRRDAAIHVYPYGAITLWEKGAALSDMAGLSAAVCAFSDDGRGVMDDGLMRDAMKMAKSLGKLIAAHCEDTRYGGAESEWRQVGRDLGLVSETGCAYHVCHVSCRESVVLLRKAKAAGLDVSCETAPHYLILNDGMLTDDGRYKMNPPIRTEDDRQALLEGLADGTIDMVATDHAPHTASEKSGGFKKSLNGVVGLETAFPVLYTELVKTGILSLEKLAALLTVNPRRRFGLPTDPGDFTVFDLGNEYEIDPAQFLSMGRATPFEGMRVWGKCILTAVGGNITWQDNSTKR